LDWSELEDYTFIQLDCYLDIRFLQLTLIEVRAYGDLDQIG